MSERSELIEIFETTLDKIEAQSQQQLKLHEVESDVLQQLLALGLQLMTYYLSLACKHFFCENTFFLRAKNGKTSRYLNKGKSTRNYQSIFGIIPISRVRYYSKTEKHSLFPLDRKLGISRNGMSYVLQDWLSESSCKLVYEQSVSLLNKILGLSIKGMQVLRINDSIHEHIGDFYTKENSIQSFSPDLTIDKWACTSFDGKGIPIRAEEVDRLIESSGDRLGRGQKKGIKKEVTVTANFLSEKRERTPESVLQSFFSVEKQEENPVKNTKEKMQKHLRGFLCNQKDAVKYGLERLIETVDESQKIIVLIDGCRGLEKAIDMHSQELGIMNRIEAKVLDFVHVTEYIWVVANAILGEKNTERSAWVKNHCLKVLRGDAEASMKEWEQYLLNHQKLSEGKKKSIQRAITYFGNHLHMMRYDEYLKKGMPISTGVVESACGHFIQQRFDANGMRWNLQGAQTLIDLKAISLNGDWKEMINLYIEREQQYLYEAYQKIAA